MGFFDRLKKGLTKTRENLTNKIEKLVIGYADIDDELLDELDETLIMADVGIETTERLMTAVRKGIRKKEINSPDDLRPFLQKEITAILSEGENETHVAEEGPTVLLVIGVVLGVRAKRFSLRRQIPSERRRSTSWSHGASTRAFLSSNTKRERILRLSPLMR